MNETGDGSFASFLIVPREVLSGLAILCPILGRRNTLYLRECLDSPD